jgi:hypothetical protein
VEGSSGDEVYRAAEELGEFVGEVVDLPTECASGWTV